MWVPPPPRLWQCCLPQSTGTHQRFAEPCIESAIPPLVREHSASSSPLPTDDIFPKSPSSCLRWIFWLNGWQFCIQVESQMTEVLYEYIGDRLKGCGKKKQSQDLSGRIATSRSHLRSTEGLLSPLPLGRKDDFTGSLFSWLRWIFWVNGCHPCTRVERQVTEVLYEHIGDGLRGSWKKKVKIH